MRPCTAVLSDSTLVITLHDSLSPAEQLLAQSQEGAQQVQEFHRQLFANAYDSLRTEIKRITGVEVREAAAEVEPSTGTVVKVFSTGSVVQVFLLGASLPDASWSGSVLTDRQTTKESGHDGYVEKWPPNPGGRRP